MYINNDKQIFHAICKKNEVFPFKEAVLKLIPFKRSTETLGTVLPTEDTPPPHTGPWLSSPQML